jgi:hypothetical protein
MAKLLAKWLRRSAEWLAPPVVEPPPRFYVRAEELAHIAETTYALGTSGEYKRSRVYAQLIKEFPTVPKYMLGMAIEHAVTAMHGNA